jgi:hypothetical protein
MKGCNSLCYGNAPGKNLKIFTVQGRSIGYFNFIFFDIGIMKHQDQICKENYQERSKEIQLQHQEEESANLPLCVKTGDKAGGILDNASTPLGIKDNTRRSYAILGKGERGQEFNFSCYMPD